MKDCLLLVFANKQDLPGGQFRFFFLQKRTEKQTKKSLGCYLLAPFTYRVL
jgi:hypothetical protein